MVWACVLSCFRCVQLFATPETVAHQAPVSKGIFQARILEWVAISSLRRSSRPRDPTRISCGSCRFFTAEPPGKPGLYGKWLVTLWKVSNCFLECWIFFHFYQLRIYSSEAIVPNNRSWLWLGNFWGFPGGAGGKEPACQCRRHKKCGFNPWVGKIPWRRGWQPTSSILAWRIPRTERSLVGYSP